MSADDAQAWLRVAAGELANLPRDLLIDGAAAARKTCTHHGQIVPTIIRETEERLAQRRKLAGPDIVPVERRIAAPEPWRPTPEELAELKAQAARNLAAD